MNQTPKPNPNPKLDKEYFELVLAYNSIYNPRYLGAIIDFYDPDYLENKDVKSVMPLVIDFFNRRNTAPNLTEINAFLCTDELKESFKNLLISFKTLDKNFNEEELYQNTETFLREKAVFKAIKHSASKLATNNLEVAEILPEFEKACGISLVDDLGFDYFEGIDIHCQDLNQQVQTLSTGWKWLDERIGGGFLKDGRQLIIFAGRTNIGKSIFLGNIALNILKQNKKVLLISLEMPEALYAKRFSAQITKIPIADLHRHTDQLKTTVLDFKNLNSDATLYIKEFPPKSVTVAHINAYIKKLNQKGHHFDAIVIDYINLLRPTKTTGSSYEDIKTISEHLRATSYLFNVPVITASQFNRKGMNNENPDMDAISESVGLTFTADLQLSIWASDEDRTAGIINLGLQKNRYGPVNEFTTLGIDYCNLLLKELNFDKDGVNTTDTPDDVNDTISKLGELGGVASE